MQQLSHRAAQTLGRHRRLGSALSLVMAVAREQSIERISLSAAAVAFWAVIAVTPTLIALALIFGRIVDPTELADAVKELQSQAPGSFSSLLATQLQAASTASTSTASWGIIVSLITVLWAVSTGVYTFSRAVRIAYGLPPQAYFSARAIAFLGALTTVLILGIVLLAAAALSAWASSLDSPFSSAIIGIEVIVGVLVLTGILWVVFRVSTGRISGALYWPGAIFGGIGVLAVVIGYGIYLQYATSYQAIYGALASSVILSLVTYVATYAVLLGAVANAQWRALQTPLGQPSAASNRPAKSGT